MATLAQLVVKLITDVTEFTKGMDTASKKLSETGQKMQQVGKGMTVGVTLPIIAAGTAAVKFASDLDETKNKTSTVFGSMSDSVFSFANSSAEDLGMSENAALSYASTYGSILSNMGLTEQKTAEMSQSLTQLTADYASFHNLKPEEAFEKIKAGLVGSSEPLISLGKDLRVAAVEAYAMKAGIASSVAEMTPAQLALARYGTLIEQSGQEMGDFQKTSEGLANSTRILQAQLEDTFASFGEILIPTVTEFLRALIPILKWFNDLPTPVKKGIVYVLMFAAALGPVISTLGTILTVGGKVAALFGSGGMLAGGLSGLSAALGSAGAAAGGLAASVGAVAAPVLVLVAAIGSLIAVLIAFGPQALATIKSIGNFVYTISYVAGKEVAKFIKSMMGWFNTLLKNIGGLSRSFYSVGRNLIIGMINGVVSVVNELIKAVLTPIYHIVSEVQRVLGIHSKSTVFKEFGKQMMLGFESGIDDFSKKPIQATLGTVQTIDNQVSSGRMSGVSGLGNGRNVTVQVQEININGDISESQKKQLKKEMIAFFTGELALALKGS